MRKAVGVVAAQQGRELSEMSEEMGVSLLSQSSLKAGLDIHWDDPEERGDALHLLVNLLEPITTWVEQGTPPSPRRNRLRCRILNSARWGRLN
jgi:hypothetical protein